MIPRAADVPEKLKDHVSPRRSLPDFVDVPTEKSAKRELERIGKAYAKKQSYDTSPKDQFEAGIALKKRDGLQATRTEAHAFLCAPSFEAIRGASIDALAFAEVASHRENRDAALATAITLARGLADAVRVMVRSLDFTYKSDGNYTKCVFVIASPEEVTPSGWVDDWNPLRNAVCAASDVEYARAREVAAALRKKVSRNRRAHIAFAFPDEPWSREDLLEIIDKPDEVGQISFLFGSCDDADIARRYLDYAAPFDYALHLPEKDALSILEAALPPTLVKPSYGPLLKSPPREIAMAIALFPTERAAAMLAPYFGHAILGPIVADYFQRNTGLQFALTSTAKGKSKAAEAAQRVLAHGKARASGPTASEAEVPRVLRERPWRTRARVAPVVLVLAVPRDVEDRVELTDAEREPRFEKENTVREMTKADLAKWHAELKKRNGWGAHVDFQDTGFKNDDAYLRVPKEEALRVWNHNEAHLNGTYLELLATHGVGAIPGFLRQDWVKWLSYGEVDDEPILDVLAHIVSPRIAPIMARVIARRKNFRRPALTWMLRYPETAALGLIPDALGTPGQARDDAERALPWLAQKGARAAIEKAAGSYGAQARAAITELLSRDPLAIDATVPKPPDFLRMGDLPAVRLKSGARLPKDAMDALIEMIRTAPLDPPYAGVPAVVESCDEASLGKLASELLDQWMLAGSPLRFEWMLFAAALFPSPDVTRRVGQLAREWARKDAKKAVRACVVLAEVGRGTGNDLPLVHLGHVAATSRWEDVRKEAQALLDDVALSRGLSPSELDDRIVPDLDLDPGGTLALSFGPRKFVVALDEGLRPFVQGEKSFPRATKTDDAVLVKAAKARFDALKADTKAVADRQIRRFEQAMVTRRAWMAPDFLTWIVGHRLLVHLARRLVWEGLPAHEAPFAFRVTADGGLADRADRAITLGEARVRVLHPVTLGDGERTAWSTAFADYRILQPFEQLSRAVAKPPTSGKSKHIDPHAEIEVAATKALGLASRGWRSDGGGYLTVYLRRLLKGGDARMALNPGISMEDVKGADVQKITRVELPVTCEELDPIDFAEITRDLAFIGEQA